MDGVPVEAEAVRRLAAVLAIVITLVWVGTLIADAVVTGYEIPTGVQPAMMLVAGALFGHALFRQEE